MRFINVRVAYLPHAGDDGGEEIRIEAFESIMHVEIEAGNAVRLVIVQDPAAE